MNLPLRIQGTLQCQPFKPQMRLNEAQRLSRSLKTKHLVPMQTQENNDDYDE